MSQAEPVPRSSTTYKRLRALFAAVAGVGCTAYLVRQLWGARNEIGRTLHFGAGTLAFLLVLMLAAHLQRAFEFNYMLRRLQVPERFRDSIVLTGTALLLNYLPFSAGSVVRGVALRRRHALPYATYVSALMVSSIVSGHVAADSGLAFVALARTRSALPLIVLFALMALASAFVLLVPTAWAPSGGGLVARQARKLAEGLGVLRRGPALAVIGGAAIGRLTFSALRLWLCLHALGQDASLADVGLLGAAALILSLVNVVPNNVGLKELVLGALAGSIGFPPALGAAAATLDRAVLFGYSVVTGLPCLYLMRSVLRAPQSEVGS